MKEVDALGKDYNHNYLRSEYNQALQAAQMAAKWQNFEKNKDFINLQYRTANDERVRASHRILHGTTLPVDDPFWKQYTPPNGWGCRCTVVAVLKDDYPVQDSHGSIAKAESCFKTPKEKMFKENLAEKKRLFPSKHPYLPKGCGECEFKKLIFESEKAICKACRKIDAASAKWSSDVTKQHFHNLIQKDEHQKWTINNGPVKEITVTRSNLDLLVWKPHKYYFAKNMAIYYLKRLLQDKSKAVYLGNTPDAKGIKARGHTDVTIWHYYKMKFLNGYSYIVIKEYNGEFIVHQIQDEDHFNEDKIKNKV
ncbi:MAG: minor capsid protein [Bacteroidales bacterium]|nr:minor capsid protein [Bacteroidales bacterium]